MARNAQAPVPSARRRLLTADEASAARELAELGRLGDAAAFIRRATGLDAHGSFLLAGELAGATEASLGEVHRREDFRAFARRATLRTVLVEAALLAAVAVACFVAWRLAGPFDALTRWLPLALLAVIGRAVWRARAPGGGAGLALLGAVLAPLAGISALGASPDQALPLPGLALSLASGLLLATGAALALHNQLRPAGAADPDRVPRIRRRRRAARTLLALHLAAPALALYGAVVFAARGVESFGNLFSFMVFVLSWAPPLAFAVSVSAWRSSTLLVATLLPLVLGAAFAVRVDDGIYAALLQCALVNVGAVLLALPLIALGLLGGRTPLLGVTRALLLLTAGALAVVLGWGALETLILEWGRLAGPGWIRLAGWVGAPAAVLALLLLMDSAALAQAGSASREAARKAA